MPKYYIKSGQIKFIIDREDYEQAILDTLQYFSNTKKKYGYKICVSEQGFDTFKNWKCYDIEKYLKK